MFAIAFPPATFVELVIWIIVVAAVIGILFVALRAFGINLPQWVIQIAVICLVALVAILAIRFVSSL